MPLEFDKFINKKDKFILDDENNVIPATLMEWGKFFETSADRRRVGRDVINGLTVSTVFIGIDQSFDGSRNIFETMIFEDEESLNYCDRYATWKEAEKGHQKAIQWVKNGFKEEEE